MLAHSRLSGHRRPNPYVGSRSVAARTTSPSRAPSTTVAAAPAPPPAPVEADLPAPPPPPADGTTVRVRLPSGTFDRKFAPEATLHTVLCAIHHESGTKLLAAKKYHFIEPGPPMMARCKADTALDSTFASLGLTGRVALNLGESEA